MPFYYYTMFNQRQGSLSASRHGSGLTDTVLFIGSSSGTRQVKGNRLPKQIKLCPKGYDCSWGSISSNLTADSQLLALTPQLNPEPEHLQYSTLALPCPAITVAMACS